MAEFVALNATYHPPANVPPAEHAQLCALATANDNMLTPWRSEPLPQDMW
jgi:hypothetical protein